MIHKVVRKGMREKKKKLRMNVKKKLDYGGGKKKVGTKGGSLGKG